MSSRDAKPLVIGRVRGLRGRSGEVTVIVVSGEAARWVQLGRVVLAAPRDGGVVETRRVESARAYRDRLVLKLAGIDDANRAAALRGYEVRAAARDVPELPRDVYWVDRLVGLRVEDATLGAIGRVVDVIETGGTDLLQVKDDAGVETLIPLAKAYRFAVDLGNGTIRLTLPSGLRGLNEDRGRETP